MADKRQMTEAELKALLSAEQDSALGFLGGELTEQREKAMKYYLSEPFGDEVEGMSSVVSSDVADTIEWIMPSLLKIFMSGDDVCRTEAQGPEDEEAAKQATEYLNWVFTRDNRGFLILYSMFKDGLLQKNGTSKVYSEESEVHEQQDFLDVPDDEFAVMRMEMEADGWRIENHEERASEAMPPEAAMPGMLGAVEPVKLHSGVWLRTKKQGRICIDPIPPEEFLISRDAKTIQEARYCAHRVRRTASELLEMGYPKSVVDTLSSDEKYDHTDERRARFTGVDEDPNGDYSVANQAMRPIWVTEAYVKVDWDGDGIAEMRKITHAGGGTTILDNDAWDGPRPFCSLTPIIMPHRFHGLSVADLVMDLQLIKSKLWRETLNNLYLTNNPRKVVDPAAVEMDDLLTVRVGGIVRTKEGADPSRAVFPLTVEFAAGASFGMLEYIDTVRENRTGVTRYNQGTDADTLNKTARGISQIMTAAQQRIELIARIFAETGVKEMFSHILWLMRQYPEEMRRTIRLRNKQWVTMEPGRWKGDFDLQISVGLGTGNRDQQLMHLTNIMAIQKEIVALQGGANGPLITMQNVHHTLSKLIENSGFKSADEFVTDPANAPPQPPQPNPEMEKAQAELQIEQQKAEQQMAIDQQKAQQDAELDRQRAAAEIELEKVKATAEAEIAMIKAKLAADVKAMEVRAKAASGGYAPRPVNSGNGRAAA